MVLVSPVTLVTPAAPKARAIPEVPALRARRAPLLPACPRWSRPPARQGLMELRPRRLEVLGADRSRCILFVEPLWAGRHGEGLEGVGRGTQASGVERGAGGHSGRREGGGEGWACADRGWWWRRGGKPA